MQFYFLKLSKMFDAYILPLPTSSTPNGIVKYLFEEKVNTAEVSTK